MTNKIKKSDKESVIKQALLVFLLFFCTIICVEACNSKQQASKLLVLQDKKDHDFESNEQKRGKKADSDYIIRAKQITKEYSLTSISIDCLSFILLEGVHEGNVVVNVRELHNEICGGDKNTSPRLFSIGFSEKDGKVYTDAKSLTGEMEPVR
jgi:hypothetical protein